MKMNRLQKRYVRKGHDGSLGVVLRRLPHDLSWKLLAIIVRALADSLGAYTTPYAEIARNRDGVGYHKLASMAGLQSINSVSFGAPYIVAALRLLSAVGKRSRQLQAVSPGDRKANALRLSLEMDSFRGGYDHWELRHVRNEIASVLDGVDPESVFEGCRHGPGATVDPRIPRDTYAKYASLRYSITPSAKPWLLEAIRSNDRWLGACEGTYREVQNIDRWRILPSDWLEDTLQVCPYNRVVTVPKDGAKDRTIAIEPLGNVYLQLGVDALIRKALKQWGIDLSSQVGNQEGARLGSIDDGLNSIVTLDLSSASDRIDRELVRALLPPDWFALLDSLRAPYGVLPDGTGWRYARMSSMGNGYTFALETLLFASTLRAIVKKFCLCPRRRKDDLSATLVYGDDCEYRQFYHRHVLAYFGHMGFIVNESKTFASGPVRESCGKEYWLGHDITPVKMPEEWDAFSLLAFRNGLVEWGERVYGDPYLFAEAIDLLDSFIPDVGTGPVWQEFSTMYRFDPACAIAPHHNVLCLQTRQETVQPREFLMGKLMHDLKSCEAETGNRFRISQDEGRAVTRWKIVTDPRVVGYGAVIAEGFDPTIGSR